MTTAARPIDLTRLVREAISTRSDDIRLQISTAIEPYPLLITMVEADARRLIDLLIENSVGAGPVLFAVYGTRDHRRVRLELAGLALVAPEAEGLVRANGGSYSARNHTTTIELPRSR